MSKDVECPYCGFGQEICHDDGFGYDENTIHEMQCCDCYKNFTFTTSISFSYYPEKADCLNGAQHNLKPTQTFPRRYSKMSCCQCEYQREMTDEEFKTHWPNEER